MMNDEIKALREEVAKLRERIAVLEARPQWTASPNTSPAYQQPCWVTPIMPPAGDPPYKVVC